jgi:hypothetical protein
MRPIVLFGIQICLLSLCVIWVLPAVEIIILGFLGYGTV